MKKRKRVVVTVEVQPRHGYSMDAWVETHAVELPTKELGPVTETAKGTYIVEVTYEAQGADASDIMRAYESTKLWRRMANVIRIDTKYIKPKGVDLAS